MSLASFQTPTSSFRPRPTPSLSEVSEEVVKYRLFLRLLERGLQTEEELWLFIQLFLGYTIPRHQVCAHHQPPFQFIADQFFERVRTVFGWACRNGGKCLAGDSLILDYRTGERKTIKAIVEGEHPDEILTMTEHGHLVQAPITAVHDTGMNQCLRVEFASGRHIVATKEHPFLTATGWYRADELEIGECIAIPSFVPPPSQPTEVPDAHVDLLAVLLAEGSYTQTSVMFSTADAEVVRIVEAACQSFSGVHVRYKSKYDYAITRGKGANRRYKNPVRKMLYDYGIGHERAPQKRIPDIIFRLSQRQLSRFLSVFWMCDGYVTAKEAEIGLSSRRFVDDIQHLLLRFGVQSRVKTRGPRHHKVTVYGQCVKVLAQHLALWGDKQSRLQNLVAKKLRTAAGRPPLTPEFVEQVRGLCQQVPWPERWKNAPAVRAALGLGKRPAGASILGLGGVKSIARRRLAALCDQGGIGRGGFEILLSEDLWWDRIIAIEDVGLVHTYDLTMTPTACFVANDILVHNTLCVAILNVCEALFKAGIEILSSAAIRDQANKGYDYVTRMLLNNELLGGTVVSSLRSETEFFNGSILRLTTGTFWGMNSQHPTKFRCIFEEDSVYLVNGTTKPIGAIERGDRVVAWNGKQFCCAVVSRVQYAGIGATIRLQLSNGNILTCTPDHKILTTEGTWLRADRVMVGAALTGRSLSPLREKAAPINTPNVKDRLMSDMLAYGLEKHNRAPKVCQMSNNPEQSSDFSLGALPDMLAPHETRATLPTKTVLGLWNTDQPSFDSVPSMYGPGSQNSSSEMLRLRSSLEAEGHAEMQETLAPVSLVVGSDRANGASPRDGAEDKSAHIWGREANDGAAGALETPIRTLGSVATMDPRLCTRGAQSSDRGPRFVLARSTKLPSARPEEEGDSGERGVARDFCEDGPDAHVVYVTGIHPGPTGRVYDLTIPGFRSFVAEGVVVHNCDEVELIHWSVLQQGLQMSISSADGKWKAGDCLTSTRKFSSGTVQRLLDQAEAKRMTIRAWCIWDVLEPCSRLCKGDPVYGDCPVYSRLDKDGNEEMICGGRAHDLPPGGFYKITDFVEKASLLDKDTWETEWLCLRPHGGALVYGDYFKDEAPFVVPTAEAVLLLKRAKEEGWVRCIGLDFGSNFYACFLTQDPLSEIWYAYSEYWWQATNNDKPLAEHGRQVKAHDLLGWHNRTQVFADPSGRQAIRDLEEPDVGLFCTPANNQVYEGINHVKKLFRRRQSDGLPGLRIFHSCTRMRLELSRLYVHKLEKSGEVNRDVIIKKDDHGVDSLRYGLFSFETVGTGRYRMKRLKGFWGLLLGVSASMLTML